MKIKIGLNKNQQRNLLKKIDRYGDNILIPIRQANERTSQQLIIAARKNLKINGTDNTGRLRASLAVLSTNRQGLIYNTGTDVDYSLAIEEGTDPHNLSDNEVVDLGDWVKKKLGASNSALPFVLYAVASGIEEDGTDAQPYLGPAAVEVKAKHSKNLIKFIKQYNKKL